MLFKFNQRTLSFAQRFLIQPKECPDFEYSETNSTWHRQKPEGLLAIIELTNETCELINWQLDGEYYRNYVFSPVITSRPGEEFN